LEVRTAFVRRVSSADVLSYETTVEVDAPVRAVWDVTLDVERWPLWNPAMTSVRRRGPGPTAVGSRFRVRQPRLGRATWVVASLEPGRVFAWYTSGLGVRIHAEHLFTATGERATEVRLRVTVSGALAAGLWYLAGETVRRFVDQEAAGLKHRCERGL
jgi:uncharacterized membrane protein